MIVDTGVLVAAADRGDRHHAACAELLMAAADIVIPILAVTEVAYFLGSRMGPNEEAAFIGSIRDGEVGIEPVDPTEWSRIHELVRRYADLGLGTVDASIVAACERLGETTLASLDRRHLAVVRPAHCDALTLVP